MNDKMNDRRLDAALDQLSLAELPEGFVPRVMASVRQGQMGERQRFDFQRYVVPGFALAFVVGLAASGAWWVSLADPQSVQTVFKTIAVEMADIPLGILLTLAGSLTLCLLFMYTGFLSYFFLISESG